MSQYAQEEPKARALPQIKTYTETELQALDAELQSRFNGLRTKHDLERYWVRDGAGSFRDGVFQRRPAAFEQTEHKLYQWARWRAHKFPFDRMATYGEWEKQSASAAQ